MSSEIASKVEFAVKIAGPKCAEEVKDNLRKIGITENEIVESVIDSSNTEFRVVIQTSKVIICLLAGFLPCLILLFVPSAMDRTSTEHRNDRTSSSPCRIFRSIGSLYD